MTYTQLHLKSTDIITIITNEWLLVVSDYWIITFETFSIEYNSEISTNLLIKNREEPKKRIYTVVRIHHGIMPFISDGKVRKV